MMTAEEMTIKLSAESHQDDTPWRAKGHKVLDTRGHVVAVAANEADAQVMAQAPRPKLLLAAMNGLQGIGWAQLLDIAEATPKAGAQICKMLADAGAEDPARAPMSAAETALQCTFRMANLIDYAMTRIGTTLWPADTEAPLPAPVDAAMERYYNVMGDGLYRIADLLVAIERHGLTEQAVAEVAPLPEPAAESPDAGLDLQILERILRLPPKYRDVAVDALAALTDVQGGGDA